MSRDVLAAHRKELKGKGKGGKPNRADPLTPEHEERMWEMGVLGDGDKNTLLNTVWYFNTKCLGQRGRDEGRSMKWGDLECKKDLNGEEYLEFSERITKTRQGQPGNDRLFRPKLFKNTVNPSKCAVQMYKKYAKERPEEMNTDDSPFYIAPNNTRSKSKGSLEKKWFKNQVVGEKKLNGMMKSMAEKAGLNGRFTNHSVRKSMVTQLLHHGVPPTIIMQLSGHKNVGSINNYGVASIEQQRGMCLILSNPSDANMNPRLFSGNQVAPAPTTAAIVAPPSETGPIAVPPTHLSAVAETRRNVDSDNIVAEQPALPFFQNANISGGTFNIYITSSNKRHMTTSIEQTKHIKLQ